MTWRAVRRTRLSSTARTDDYKINIIMDSLKKVEATLHGSKVELSYLVLSNK